MSGLSITRSFILADPAYMESCRPTGWQDCYRGDYYVADLFAPAVMGLTLRSLQRYSACTKFHGRTTGLPILEGVASHREEHYTYHRGLRVSSHELWGWRELRCFHKPNHPLTFRRNITRSTAKHR